MTLFLIVLATFTISALSLVAAFFLTASSVWLKKMTFWLVSLAAGTMMGAAFWHLLPEAIEQTSVMTAMNTLLLGFVGFFVVEKTLHWQHCHKTDCTVHSFGYLNLIGDSLHNFLDGLAIASAMMVSPALGVTTTLAIALHEIPQELGDLGVLIHAGFSRRRALMANFVTALTAVLGGVVGYFLQQVTHQSTTYLLPLAAGGFLYIASSDLIPELKREGSLKRSGLALMWFLAGLAIMYAALFTEAG